MAALLAPLLSIVTFVGDAVGSHGLVEEALSCHHVALGRQQEVNCLAQLVDSTVEVFPDAFDLDVCFIHPPAATDWML